MGLIEGDLSAVTSPEERKIGVADKEACIIRPPRESKLRRFESDYIMPLNLFKNVKDSVQPGRKYRLQLGTLGFGVQWWVYDSNISPTASSEPAKPVASKLIHKEFLVESLPKPPRISVSMSLSTNLVHRSNKGRPPTRLRFYINSESERPVTVRSNGDQAFINSVKEGRLGTPSHHRITSIKPCPSLTNYSIISCTNTRDLVSAPAQTCSLVVGRR